MEKFEAALGKAEDRARAVLELAGQARCCLQEGRAAPMYERALRLQENAEKLALLARSLPAYTGAPRAAHDVQENIKSQVPVEIGFTGEGWFRVEIPALLPRKERGSVDYIRQVLLPAMREFFRDREPVRYADCVVAYRHVYDRDRPERRMRDHDNIETNIVTDILALYLMPDDGPPACSHYECSARGERDRTEAYVVPRKEFGSWLAWDGRLSQDG